MKILFTTPALLFICSYCCAANLSPVHPIIGSWQLDVPGIACSEIYDFKASGTSLAKSAAEIAESKFEISAKPSPAGYYKLIYTVVKSNGKLDCTGKSTPVGNVVDVFVHFEPTNNAFSFCITEAEVQCLGPLKRVPMTHSP